MGSSERGQAWAAGPQPGPAPGDDDVLWHPRSDRLDPAEGHLPSGRRRAADPFATDHPQHADLFGTDHPQHADSLGTGHPQHADLFGTDHTRTADPFAPHEDGHPLASKGYANPFSFDDLNEDEFDPFADWSTPPAAGHPSLPPAGAWDGEPGLAYPHVAQTHPYVGHPDPYARAADPYGDLPYTAADHLFPAVPQAERDDTPVHPCDRSAALPTRPWAGHIPGHPDLYLGTPPPSCPHDLSRDPSAEHRTADLIPDDHLHAYAEHHAGPAGGEFERHPAPATERHPAPATADFRTRPVDPSPGHAHPAAGEPSGPPYHPQSGGTFPSEPHGTARQPAPAPPRRPVPPLPIHPRWLNAQAAIAPVPPGPDPRHMPPGAPALAAPPDLAAPADLGAPGSGRRAQAAPPGSVPPPPTPQPPLHRACGPLPSDHIPSDHIP
ncbi:MAG TPA: hypothetical protein VFP72_00085, partial [Kineosporiaceae bacterium]|nr:hypothetical protein [Kineosporiaceae bacterium]